MQEITNEILKVFEDLERMQFKKEQNSVGTGEKDRYGYPFEPCDAFSTRPLEFAETALRLDIEAREMFAMLCTLNRHSSLFYRLSGQFEKILSLLGSCCITKAVIEQQENDTFELLHDLTIDSLREMAAFNFRKCSAAFMESRSCGKINLEAFNLSVRWAALDKRLIATEEKIRSGRWSVAGGQKSAEDRTQYPVPGTQNEMPVEGEQLPEAGDHATGKLPVSAFAEKGRAFPVMEGTVREGTAGCRRELSPETREIRNRRPEIRNEFSGKQPVRGFSEEDEKQFMRETLMYEAMDRGDRLAYEAAARASDPELETLWQDFLQRETANGFAFIEKMCAFGDGPEDPPPENEEWSELFEPASVLN